MDVVLCGADLVPRRRHLSVVHETVRVQSQRPCQRPRLFLQQQLLQGIYTVDIMYHVPA